MQLQRHYNNVQLISPEDRATREIPMKQTTDIFLVDRMGDYRRVKKNLVIWDVDDWLDENSDKYSYVLITPSPTYTYLSAIQRSQMIYVGFMKG